MDQSKNNNNTASVSNLKISTDKIVFDPQTHTSEVVLTNLHPKYTLYFKIKTKIQKLFDVKPCLGSIEPFQQLTVTFKPLKKIETGQIANLQQNLLFLLQAVNHTNPALSREEEETLWKEVKAKKANVQLGYCSAKLGVTFSPDKSKEKEFLPQFYKTMDSKIDSRSSSEVGKPIKASSTISSSLQSNLRQPSERDDQHKNEQELSKKYEQLKEREEKLMRERQKMFEEAPLPKKAKGRGPSPWKIIILIILTFLLGNLIRWLLQSKQVPKIDVEKDIFDWFS